MILSLVLSREGKVAHWPQGLSLYRIAWSKWEYYCSPLHGMPVYRKVSPSWQCFAVTHEGDDHGWTFLSKETTRWETRWKKIKPSRPYHIPITSLHALPLGNTDIEGDRCDCPKLSRGNLEKDPTFVPRYSGYLKWRRPWKDSLCTLWG